MAYCSSTHHSVFLAQHQSLVFVGILSQGRVLPEKFLVLAWLENLLLVLVWLETLLLIPVLQVMPL